MTENFSNLLGRNGHFGKKRRFFEVFIKISWPKNAVLDKNSVCFSENSNKIWEEISYRNERLTGKLMYEITPKRGKFVHYCVDVDNNKSIRDGCFYYTGVTPRLYQGLTPPSVFFCPFGASVYTGTDNCENR